jgi:UDP-glucuronate decarboxylase
MTKASVPLRRSASTCCAPVKVDARVARIFNTYGPRMQPNDGRIISNLLVQALLEKSPDDLWKRRRRRAPSASSATWSAGLISLMDVDPNPGVPVNLGNPGEFTINELADMVLDMVPSRPKSFIGRCRRTIRSDDARISRARKNFSAGSRTCRLQKA